MTKNRRIQGLNRQLDRLRSHADDLYQTSSRLSWLRLVTVILTLAVAGLVFYFAGAWLAGLCLAAGLVLFGLAVHLHQRTEHEIARHQTWTRIKATHIARARLDWDHLPPGFSQQPRRQHPFEADLDIAGSRSLHRLLDTAVSYEGSQRLLGWLTSPVPRQEDIHRRQALVRELAPRHLFRDKLTLNAMVSAGASRTWKADSLVGWLEHHAPGGALRLWLLLLAAMAALNAALFFANLAGWIPPVWRITFVLYLGLMLIRSRGTTAAWEEALTLGDALRQLRYVFAHLESWSYHGAPRLQALCAPFLNATHQPSRYLARINSVVAAMGIRGNPVLWFAVNAVVPWDLYFAHRLNQTKAAMAQHAPAWMDIWFELEALGSLANFAYLNPTCAFPHVLPAGPTEQVPILQAQSLGHPLIPDDERIANDLLVPALGQVAIITGSNMAGKSVFLKTVGINLALAYAGEPVVANYLETRLFRLFTSMAIEDSVTGGISYFYAEVKRLKALLNELEGDHPLPLLFCIDEIFRGTNNRERLAGSRAYVQALAGQRGVGLIATHDLALAELGDAMAQVVNYHFRDRVLDDRMVFDYVLRPGPCPTTNALTIMQREGLPVPDTAGQIP